MRTRRGGPPCARAVASSALAVAASAARAAGPRADRVIGAVHYTPKDRAGRPLPVRPLRRPAGHDARDVDLHVRPRERRERGGPRPARARFARSRHGRLPRLDRRRARGRHVSRRRCDARLLARTAAAGAVARRCSASTRSARPAWTSRSRCGRRRSGAAAMPSLCPPVRTSRSAAGAAWYIGGAARAHRTTATARCPRRRSPPAPARPASTSSPSPTTTTPSHQREAVDVPGLLRIVGEEVTTPGGHVNVWGLGGVRDFVDFRVGPATRASATLVQAAAARGASSASTTPPPSCAGLRWEHAVPAAAPSPSRSRTRPGPRRWRGDRLVGRPAARGPPDHRHRRQRLAPRAAAPRRWPACACGPASCRPRAILDAIRARPRGGHGRRTTPPPDAGVRAGPPGARGAMTLATGRARAVRAGRHAACRRLRGRVARTSLWNGDGRPARPAHRAAAPCDSRAARTAAATCASTSSARGRRAARADEPGLDRTISAAVIAAVRAAAGRRGRGAGARPADDLVTPIRIGRADAPLRAHRCGRSRSTRTWPRARTSPRSSTTIFARVGARAPRRAARRSR